MAQRLPLAVAFGQELRELVQHSWAHVGHILAQVPRALLQPLHALGQVRLFLSNHFRWRSTTTSWFDNMFPTSMCTRRREAEVVLVNEAGASQETTAHFSNGS